jgi:hypothetical protein
MSMKNIIFLTVFIIVYSFAFSQKKIKLDTVHMVIQGVNVLSIQPLGPNDSVVVPPPPHKTSHPDTTTTKTEPDNSAIKPKN